MSRSPAKVFLVASLTAAASLFLGIAPAKADLTISATEGPGHPLKAFIDNAGQGVNADPMLSADADIGVLNTSNETRSYDDDHDAMVAILKKGGSVIVGLGGTAENIHKFEDVMPVNFWSAERNSLQRLSTGAIAPEGSPFATLLQQTPGFRLPFRYDLHLPYSPMETGQHRYEWEQMGKQLLNTDWQVLLTSDQDGHLPLLVEGRCYAGHVFIFGGDLCAPDLTNWSGYAAFVQALLAAAKPQPVPQDPPVDGLKLAVDPYQPGSGDLHVNVTNSGSGEINAVLCVKVRNLVHGLMNSLSKEITVPAGQTIAVTFPEGAPVRDASAAPISGEAELPFRRLELGLCGRDRQAIAVNLETVVDRTPATTLMIQGEDVRNFPPTDHWAAGGINVADGTSSATTDPIDRYTYFTGDTPKVTVRLGNGRHNIAPLAVPTDVNWPDNFSVQGLNDGACEFDNLRGTYDVCGFWAGRPSDTQQVKLTWPASVLVTAQRLLGQTSYRHHDALNPVNYTLTADNGGTPATLATVQAATYTNGIRTDEFAAQPATSCTLNITGLDTDPKTEPLPYGSGHPPDAGGATNCEIGEWEIEGWPSATPPPKLSGHLVVKLHDLTTDQTSVLLEKDVTVDPLAQTEFPVDVPTRQTMGQVSVETVFQPSGGGDPVTANFPLLFVSEQSPHLTSRETFSDVSMGLLCSPGFNGLQPFGIGDDADCQGWGGPDDNFWAWSHDMMETGSDPRSHYVAQRFLLSVVGMSHYTDPYHDFGSGQYGWDWAGDRLVDAMTTGRYKNSGAKTLHVTLADRWNGVAIGASFTWSDLIRFDEHLRAEGKPGLQGRTRADLCKEITSQHADEYQSFQLQRYADSMTSAQKKLSAVGIDFTAETHGSFPLAGGAIGAQLATADIAVGTDLFWELRDEDVYKGIGYRFGLVSANPDLRSGAYDQWGWNSGTQENATWFSPSSEVEPSRRQWYSTYFKGRITSDGQYLPYTVYGFSMQGNYGVKNTQDDWTKFNRVQSTMVWVRPEKPVGVGIVASWQLQVNHMTPNSTAFGFGLLAGNGYHPDDGHNHDGAFPQVDAEVGEAFYRLVKDGVPVSFVASTDTLKKWNGAQPLVAVDGFETDPWEIAEFDRLNKGGAPIIALGSEGSSGRTDAEALFGVKKTDGGWTPDQGTQVINDGAGQPLAYVCKRDGRAPTLFCPLPIATIDSEQTAIIANAVEQLCGQPVTVPYGIAASPFISEGSLFLTLGNLGDTSRVLDVTVRPSAFDPAFSGQSFRVVDHDRAVVIPSEWKDGALHFQVPTAPCDGRLIQLVPAT